MFKRYLHIMTATKKRVIEQIEEYVHNDQEVTKAPTPESTDSSQSVNKTAFQAPKNEKEISQISANP